LHDRLVLLLRDVAGNPFRPAVADPAHLSLTVSALARAAYDERTLPGDELDPVRLAVRADALEESWPAGGLVEHVRGPTVHVRGWWAVEAVLSRN
jgi:hypothetical protein